MGWLAAIFFAAIVIAAPYFAIVGGLVIVVGIITFAPDISSSDQLLVLILFDAVGATWVILKFSLMYVESRKRKRMHRVVWKARTKRVARSRRATHPAEDAYAVFGLTPSCTMEELHQAWRQAVKNCHPDRLMEGDIEALRHANERLSELNIAYEKCRRGRAATVGS